MTPKEAQAVLATLTTAWWAGRAMPAATAHLYAQRLADLPFDAAMQAVLDLIDTHPSSIPPTIALIREHALEHTRAAARTATRNELPAARSLDELERRWKAAPWYIQLQIRRLKAGRKPGDPLAESDGTLEERAALDADLAAYGLTRPEEARA